MHCCVLQISCIQGIPLYPVSAEHFSFLQFQPWMSLILTRSHLVLLAIFNIQGAVLCLLRFWAPQSVVLTTGPSRMSILALVTHDCAPMARMSILHVQTPPQPTQLPQPPTTQREGTLGRRCS